MYYYNTIGGEDDLALVRKPADYSMTHHLSLEWS